MNRAYWTYRAYGTHKIYESHKPYKSNKPYSWMINAVINFLEDRIFAFDVGKPRLVDLAGVDHLVKPLEAVDVVFEAFDRVLRHPSRGDDEGPIGGLRQQQFSPGLIQRAFQQAVGMREAPGEFDRPVFGGVLVHVHPIGLPVDPDAVVTLGAPRRRGRRLGLIVAIDAQVIDRRDQFDLALVVVNLFEKVEEELRPLEPRVAVQIGVVRRDDHWGSPKVRIQMARLTLTVEHEISGMRGGLARSPFGHVGRLFVERDFAGDAVIFDPHVAPRPVVV